MRYYLDCEFIDDSHTIDLISIGIVCEDGRELYLQSVEFDIDKASPWVRANVIKHLDPCPYVLTHPPYPLDILYAAIAQHRKGRCINQIYDRHHRCPWRTREALKSDILAFMDIEAYGKPELWGWCAGYDFVALCQLFGTMMDIPSGYPHYIRDIQYLLDERGITDDMLPKQEEGLHNALSDALHIKRLWENLQ